MPPTHRPPCLCQPGDLMNSPCLRSLRWEGVQRLLDFPLETFLSCPVEQGVSPNYPCPPWFRDDPLRPPSLDGYFVSVMFSQVVIFNKAIPDISS